MEKKGIDVSQWNGKIHWPNVKEDGVSHVWVRSSYGASKSLNVYTDTSFHVNAEGALLQGLNVAPYHFSTLNSYDIEADAKKEGQFFLMQIKSFPFNWNAVLDLESNNLNLSPEEVLTWVAIFSDVVEQAISTKLILYSYTPFLNQFLPHGIDMPLWLAQYPRQITETSKPIMPNGWDRLFAWQYSAKGKVPGIQTDVDMNKIYL